MRSCSTARDRVIAWTKKHTTLDVSSGIEAALDAVLDQLGEQASRVGRVMLGTTHGINAILQRRGLARILTIRLGGPATESVPPLLSWPAELRDAVLVASAILPGGNYVEGRSIRPLDPSLCTTTPGGARRFCDAIAVTGVFSPAYREQELEVGAIIRDALGIDVWVSAPATRSARSACCRRERDGVECGALQGGDRGHLSIAGYPRQPPDPGSNLLRPE